MRCSLVKIAFRGFLKVGIVPAEWDQSSVGSDLALFVSEALAKQHQTEPALVTNRDFRENPNPR